MPAQAARSAKECNCPYGTEQDQPGIAGRISEPPRMFVELANFNGLRVDEPSLNGNHCRMVKTVAKDPPSAHWLGQHARSLSIRESGLWNVNYVDAPYDATFLDTLHQHILRTSA